MSVNKTDNHSSLWEKKIIKLAMLVAAFRTRRDCIDLLVGQSPVAPKSQNLCPLTVIGIKPTRLLGVCWRCGGVCLKM